MPGPRPVSSRCVRPRFVDVAILEPLGHVLFAYSGAIQPVVDAIDSRTSLLEDVGASKAPAAYTADATRSRLTT